MLIRKGFFEYIDFLYSNEDVNLPKPNAEIYMQCMIKAKVNPDETVIIEGLSHRKKRSDEKRSTFMCSYRF